MTGESNQRKVSQKKLVNTLERIYNKAIGFKNEHKLGVYKKARLGNTFRWELQELGYDKQFVEKVKDAGLPCEVALQKGLGGVRDPKLSIGAIKVDGDKATAQVNTSALDTKTIEEIERALERLRAIGARY